MRAQIASIMDDAHGGSCCARNSATVFETPPGSNYPPISTSTALTPGAPCRIDGPGGAIEALPFTMDHGDIDALGFRFGGVAYTPDLHAVPGAKSAKPARASTSGSSTRCATQPHPSHLRRPSARAGSPG